MDGSRFFFLSLTLSISLFSTFAQADPNSCDWSCGKISPKDKTNQNQTAAIQALLKNASSTCAMPSDFDNSQNLALGGYQTLAIANKTCDLKKNVPVAKTDNFLYQAMKLQGIKLYQGQKGNDPHIKNPTVANAPIAPSDLYKMGDDIEFASVGRRGKDDWCLDSVAENSPLKVGDILAGQNDTLIIDSLGKDPFGYETKIAKNPKKLKLKDNERDDAIGINGVILNKAHDLCDEWVLQTKDYQITVSYSGGKAALFPTFGSTNSDFLTAMTAKATSKCVGDVTQAILDANFPGGKSDFTFSHPADSGGVKVLRASAEASCHLKGSEMPPDSTSSDAACVRLCCKETQ